MLHTRTGADTELELHTVFSVHLLGFIFSQQMERGFFCRSPMAGGSGEWDAVLSSSFCLHKVSQQAEEELNLCAYDYE